MDEVKQSKHLRLINNLLSAVVLLLALYIFLTPWLPQVGFWWRQHFGAKPPLVAANTVDSKPQQNNENIPKENTLVIPKLLMQQQIFDGPGLETLRKGIWHRPASSSPDLGGNTVIVGHRFTYTNPSGPFYFLDRVAVGDKIVVYWQQKKYIYQVDKAYVTNANDASVEAASDTPMLTLYTCTPLWSAKDRLVIQAKPVEAAQ